MATIAELLQAPTESGGSGGPPPGRNAPEGVSLREVLPWALPVLGMAFARHVPPAQVAAYRTWLGRMAREAAPHTPMRGGEWVNKLFRGPWWHGTPNPETVLKKGFSPTEIGRGGIRFGEPSGVSLSASPYAAEQFAHKPEVLRVWPNVDPKSVLPVWSQEAAGPLHKAYLQALEGKGIHTLQPGASVAEELASHMPPDVRPDTYMLQHAMEGLRSENPELVKAFNEYLARLLRKEGVQGLLYNPRRYGEFELRVLDPHRAVPMESRPSSSAPWEDEAVKAARRRYMMAKQKLLSSQFHEAMPKDIVSLSDLYKLIDVKRILRGQ